MRIGIDVSPLQGPHSMRGIGSVLKNFLKNIPKNTNDFFILYFYDNNYTSVQEIIDILPFGPEKYEVRQAKATKHQKSTKFEQIVSQLRKIKCITSHVKLLGYANSLRHNFQYDLEFQKGSKKYGKVDDLDAFIQFDPDKPLAKLPRGSKNYLIAYDLIPYVLDKDYLISYHTARQLGQKIVDSLKNSNRRKEYIHKMRLNTKKADVIISISETTKNDFEKYLKVPSDKIAVSPLGSASKEIVSTIENGTIKCFHESPWGYISREEHLSEKPFLLFVGGADNRRRLDDLITAFNNLRAQGSDLRLILSGDTMKGAKTIPSLTVKNRLETSSYKDDIYFVGFTDDNTRNWLYKNAVAFIFPSIYEGFGLPVLEAMNLGTPVVCYRSRAVQEVAGDTPFYVSDTLGIVDAVKEITLQSKNNKIQKRLTKGVLYAKKYSWKNTAKELLATLHKQ